MTTLLRILRIKADLNPKPQLSAERRWIWERSRVVDWLRSKSRLSYKLCYEYAQWLPSTGCNLLPQLKFSRGGCRHRVQRGELGVAAQSLCTLTRTATTSWSYCCCPSVAPPPPKTVIIATFGQTRPLGADIDFSSRCHRYQWAKNKDWHERSAAALKTLEHPHK